MLIGEPTPTRYDLNFELMGIPVRVHPLFWVAGALFGGGSQLNSMLMGIVALFVSILIHEFGHALVMRSLGDAPRVVLYFMGGLAIPDSIGNSWKVSSSRRRSPWSQIAVAAAGPGAGFVFAGLIIALVLSIGKIQFVRAGILPYWIIDVPNPQLGTMLNLLLYINIFWGLINLLPVIPLDGGQIATQVLTMSDPWNGIRNALLLSAITGGLMAYFAFVHMHSMFTGMMFGSLAANSFMALQQQGGGQGGYRPW